MLFSEVGLELAPLFAARDVCALARVPSGGFLAVAEVSEHSASTR